MEPFKVIWLSEYIFSSYICVCVCVLGLNLCMCQLEYKEKVYFQEYEIIQCKWLKRSIRSKKQQINRYFQHLFFCCGCDVS